MKKTLAVLGAAALLLAGCSSSNSSDTTTTDDSAAVKESTSAAETSNTAHVATDDGEISATVTKADGKITGVSIDESTADVDSKKELGADYNMKSASSIGKEWNEQIEFLENYIIEHGVDSVKLDADGYAEEEDVKSGCTINLSKIMQAVDEAASK